MRSSALNRIRDMKKKTLAACVVVVAGALLFAAPALAGPHGKSGSTIIAQYS